MAARKSRVVAALILELILLPLVTAALPALAAPATPQALPLDVVVSEIAWMGTTTSYNDEWIELYNNAGTPVDLAGWT